MKASLSLMDAFMKIVCANNGWISGLIKKQVTAFCKELEVTGVCWFPSFHSTEFCTFILRDLYSRNICIEFSASCA